MTRENLFAAFFFVVLLALVYQFYVLLGDYLRPAVWAALLALVFYPVQQRVERWLGNRKGLAAFLLTTVVIGFVMVPTIYLLTVAATESVTAYGRLQEAIQSGAAAEWFTRLRTLILDYVGHYLPDRVRNAQVDVPGLILRASQGTSTFLVTQVSGAVANLLLFLLNFFLTTLVLFFFLRDGDQIVAYLRAIIPMEATDRDAILAQLSETLTAVVVGTVVTASVQGVLAGIGYWGVGIPFPLLLGVASAVLSFLPGGIGFIWIPCAIFLGIEGHWGRLIGFVFWFVVVVGTVDNFLRPLIIGGRVRLPTLLLFLGILGGLQVYGLLGMFVGPAVLAILLTFVQIYAERYVGR